MSNDIARILTKFDQLNEGLNQQQTAVKQMPALFKMKSQGPVLGGDPNRPAPSKGYYFGGESEDAPTPNRGGYNRLRDRKDYLDKRDILFRQLTPGIDPQTREAIKDRLAQLEKAAEMSGLTEDTEDNPMRDAVIGRIGRGRMDLVEKYGLEAVMDAVDDVTEGDTDWEEIGSSDVSAYIKRVEDLLRDHYGSRDEVVESATTEDVISTVKKKLGDYLQDIATQIKTDPDLKNKMPQDMDRISPVVKTITTDDGKEIKIHGNEDDGFRITIKNKALSSKFDNLDEAVMACEMYCARRRRMSEQQLNNDYLEER
jgi:hypothetical protein